MVVNDQELREGSENKFVATFLYLIFSHSHWPVGPVGKASPLTQHQNYWPRASGEGFISQTDALSLFDVL